MNDPGITLATATTGRGAIMVGVGSLLIVLLLDRSVAHAEASGMRLHRRTP
jgi:hypothetical protein